MRLFRTIFLGFTLSFAGMANAEGIITNQADIVDIAASISIGEIQAAKIAMQKAQDPEVKKFAEQMHKEHDAMNKELMQLNNKLGIPDDRSERSVLIKKKNQLTLKRLNDKTGNEFDEVYIEDQVMMHKLALETLEHSLIPSAEDTQLKALLRKSHEKIASHLKHAQALEEKMDN